MAQGTLQGFRYCLQRYEALGQRSTPSRPCSPSGTLKSEQTRRLVRGAASSLDKICKTWQKGLGGCGGQASGTLRICK